MFSLSFLFITIPLYFSHVFMHFGVMMGDVSFERQKMYLFIFTILIALAEMILTRYDGFIAGLKKYGCLLIGLVLLPLVPTLLYSGEIDTYWIRGSYEKFHGYLLYIGIIILGFCLSLLKMSEKRRLITLSMIPVALVSVVAILEGLSVQVFFPPSAGAWGEGVRAISTLGNPNYLAGYLLIMLPLVGYIRTPERYILAFLLLGALLMTGSYIGLTIAGIYLLYLATTLITEKYTRKKNILSLIFFSVIVGFLIIGYFLIPTDKLLSLSGRFVLMGELLREIVHFPLSLIIGYGPEAILKFFSESRTATVDAYFPQGSIIDSSHNIILDIIFQYGIMPIILLIAVVTKRWSTWNPHARASWILGIAFLIFNPYVVIHLTLLTLTLSLHDDHR